MHTKKLITLSLITLTALSVTACGKKEVVSVEVPTSTTETVKETVKPAEPIVVSVEPINEAKEEEVEVVLPDPDLDYYGKVETEKTTYTTGLPTISEDTSSAVPSSEPLDENGSTALANELYGEVWHVEYFEGGTW